MDSQLARLVAEANQAWLVERSELDCLEARRKELRAVISALEQCACCQAPAPGSLQGLTREQFLEAVRGQQGDYLL
jgi:hypothetical protein